MQFGYRDGIRRFFPSNIRYLDFLASLLNFRGSAHHHITVQIGREITNGTGFGVTKNDQLQTGMKPAIIRIPAMGQPGGLRQIVGGAIKIET